SLQIFFVPARPTKSSCDHQSPLPYSCPNQSFLNSLSKPRDGYRSSQTSQRFLVHVLSVLTPHNLCYPLQLKGIPDQSELADHHPFPGWALHEDRSPENRGMHQYDSLAHLNCDVQDARLPHERSSDPDPKSYAEKAPTDGVYE